MASGLSRRVSRIEQTLALLIFFHDRLKYLQLPITDLMEAACRSENLRQLPWLAPCLARMRRGEPFSRCWPEEIAGQQHLDSREKELLAALGGVLGLTDLESQLSMLSYTREQMGICLESARERRDKYQKLYSTLGVLAGVAIAIVLV